MSATAVARRYARALLDLSVGDQDPQTVREALAAARALLAEHTELSGALNHPAVAAESKRRLAVGVWGRPGNNALVGRLLALLAERGRIALLPAIEERFTTLWNEQRRVVSAEVVSAVPLDAAQQEALSAAVRSKTGLGVELSAAVDATLLGGLLVRMGGRTFDGSVRARLKALRHRIAAGA
jgi:F-type H+-transporting ATPase subunit delta